MGRFDFITDEAFRLSLESDYAELRSALTASMWKSAHVLAGSVVEAVVIDFLITAGHITRESGLKMDLAGAVSLAKDKGIIDGRSVDLSTVVRSYRNLIHPGRTIRLQERVDPNSARVALALVEMIIDAVAASRRDKYGYTAEQILNKLERDSAADAILPHLLREANPVEIDRLLRKVLPERLLALHADFEAPNHLRASIQLCFRLALGLAASGTQVEVAKRFVSVIKEESDTVVSHYGAAFFTADQLSHLSADDVNLVKQHLFSRLRRDHDETTLVMLGGLGPHLDEKDAPALMDGIVRTALDLDGPDPLKKVRSLLFEWTTSTPKGFDDAAKKRLSSIATRYGHSQNKAAVAAINDIIEAIDLPF